MRLYGRHALKLGLRLSQEVAITAAAHGLGDVHCAHQHAARIAWQKGDGIYCISRYCRDCRAHSDAMYAVHAAQTQAAAVGTWRALRALRRRRSTMTARKSSATAMSSATATAGPAVKADVSALESKAPATKGSFGEAEYDGENDAVPVEVGDADGVKDGVPVEVGDTDGVKDGVPVEVGDADGVKDGVPVEVGVTRGGSCTMPPLRGRTELSPTLPVLSVPRRP